MKKFTLLCALLCTFFAFAQFPEKDPLLLKGHKIKMDDYSDEDLRRLAPIGFDKYENFYTDMEHRKTYKGTNSQTPIKELRGRVLTVSDVVYNEKQSAYWIELTDGIEKFYYRSYKDEKQTAPFKPIDLEYAPEYWDKYISADSKHNTFTANKDLHFNIVKRVDAKGKAGYYLSLYSGYSTDCTDEKGVQLFLEGGEVLKFPNFIVDHAIGALYMAGGFIEESSVKKLSEKEITGMKWCEKEIKFYEPIIFKNIMARLSTTK